MSITRRPRTLEDWGAWLLLGAGIALPGCGGETEGGTNASGGTGGSGGGAAALCATPTPVGGPDSGWVRCANGRVHRERVATCTSELPRTTSCTPETDAAASACATDADCTENPHGYCALGEFGDPYCGCRYGCTTDAECGAGNVCVCGSPVGHCAPADCTSDADCGAGQVCADHDSSQGCGSTRFTCTTPADTCFADADCDGGLCSVEGTARACLPWGCAIGRPFIVEGAPRQAALRERADWCGGAAMREEARSSAAFDPAPALPAALRAELAQHWVDVGRAEHASVAAFARFTMQLLALGAPAELVRAALAAGGDEIRHAEACWGIARALGGAPVGPGALELAGALGGAAGSAAGDTTDAVQVARLAFIEGCVGETVAALEAGEAARAAADPALGEVLARIAADEAEHARLAWGTVRWLVACDAAVLPALRGELARAEHALASGDDADGAPHRPELLAHGVVDGALRAELRRRVLAGIVRPALDVLARAPVSRRGGARALRDEGGGGAAPPATGPAPAVGAHGAPSMSAGAEMA